LNEPRNIVGGYLLPGERMRFESLLRESSGVPQVLSSCAGRQSVNSMKVVIVRIQPLFDIRRSDLSRVARGDSPLPEVPRESTRTTCDGRDAAITATNRRDSRDLGDEALDGGLVNVEKPPALPCQPAPETVERLEMVSDSVL